MKEQSTYEKGLHMDIPIRFVKEYKKPENAGGKVIQKGREVWVTQEFAAEMIKAGYAIIIEAHERKLVHGFKEELSDEIKQDTDETNT